MTHGARRTAGGIRWVLVLLTCGLAASSGSNAAMLAGAQPADPGPTRILFVGNSLTYTNDLPEMLLAMLRTIPGGEYRVESVTIPGAGLQDHWAGGSARKEIASGNWDVVAMQQGPSATEGRPSLLEYSGRFAAEIRAAGAIPVLYMVWPSVRRPFDADGVGESYALAAERVGGGLFPVGVAWRIARREEPAIELYGRDGFHPTVEGSYLAALVMFGQLTGRSPEGLPRSIRTSSGLKRVSEADAGVLQRAAALANSETVVACSLHSGDGCSAP